MQKFYLSDEHDTARLAEDGHIYPAHDCEPMYFGTPSEAYAYCQGHPKGELLRVHAVAGADVIDELEHQRRNKFLSNYAEAILDGE